MGARGTKPLPANVHRLRGNPSQLRQDELRAREGINPRVVLPKPPAHLLPEAKREWRRLGKELEALGLISELDRAALAAYCQSYARWVGAEKELKSLGADGCVDTTPSGYKQIGVWLQISNRCVDQMHKFMGEFGLTPSARTRVQPSQQRDLFNDDGDSGKTGTGRFFRD